MKKYLSCLVFCTVVWTASAQSPKTYRLVWADEFNYKGLPDPQKWSYDTGGHGWGNQERQYYTAKESKNAKVENGHLVITARQEKTGNNDYSSARLVSRNKGDWQYGKIQVRAKLPKGRGTWPAIWMLPTAQPLHWPDDGEIDIMEAVGWDPENIHGSIHTKAFNHIDKTQKTDSIHVPGAHDGFQLYELEWTPETIEVSANGKKYFRFKNPHLSRKEWPFDQPFHLILNIAVGGFWGNVKGIDAAAFPAKMEIDYVRVYQYQP